MLANREGLFHAYPVDIGVSETRENKLLQVAVCYQLFEELVQGRWTDILSEGLEITGYHILEKRDHSLNDRTIEALKAALGWDGRDPFWLQDNAEALSQKPVQVRLGFEEYNGSTRLRVQFINPHGSKRVGVGKADDGMRRTVANRLGPKFRALAGGAPAPAAKPAGNPARGRGSVPATRGPSPSASLPPEAPAGCSMEEAWASFCASYEKLGPKGNPEDREQQWFAALGKLFPGRQPSELSARDWGTVAAEAPGMICPF